MNSPVFSIVVPTQGSPSSLLRLLNSLRKINKNHSFEVLLIFNPKERLTPHSFDDFSDLNIIESFSAKGVNAARNKGLELARGEFILFLDDDCEVCDENFLELHYKNHLENPDFFAIGGLYRNTIPKEIFQAYNDIQNTWIQQNILTAKGEVTVLLGGHFSIKRVSPLPEFDSSIEYGGSETEYFFRLYRSGFRFLLINCAVNHFPVLNTRTLANKALLQGRTHAHLLRNDLFIQGKLVRIQHQYKNRYEKLYHSIFNQEKIFSAGKFKKPSLLSRLNWLKHYHHTVCFYLENRNLF